MSHDVAKSILEMSIKMNNDDKRKQKEDLHKRLQRNCFNIVISAKTKGYSVFYGGAVIFKDGADLYFKTNKYNGFLVDEKNNTSVENIVKITDDTLEGFTRRFRIKEKHEGIVVSKLKIARYEYCNRKDGVLSVKSIDKIMSLKYDPNTPVETMLEEGLSLLSNMI